MILFCLDTAYAVSASEKGEIMLHVHPQVHSNWPSPRDSAPEHKTLYQFMVLAAVVVVILASLAMLFNSTAFGNTRAIQGVASVDPKQDSHALPNQNSPDPTNQLIQYYAQDFYNSGHAGGDYQSSASLGAPDSVQAALQSLQQDQPSAGREAAISAFVLGPSSIVPMLLDGLTNSDPSVRQSAAEILGARQAPDAADALFFATYDSAPGVRAAAIKALGELGAMYALPRMTWLQVTETDADVQLTARLAEKQIYSQVAGTLGVAPGDLRVVAVAPSSQRAYAATKGDLYSPDGLNWGRVGMLPDIPTALAATGDDGRVLYLGTATSGVFRSLDGGVTWHAINRNLPAANPFAVTALTINPEDDRKLYIALGAASGISPLMPFGLFQSINGGDSWAPLTQWHVDGITTRLVLEASEPARLLGLTDGGTWQYSLAEVIGQEP
jgi:hypothetical protein